MTNVALASTLAKILCQSHQLSTVFPKTEREGQGTIICVNRKNKRKKTSDTLIAGKETIQEPFKPRKQAEENALTDVEKGSTK